MYTGLPAGNSNDSVPANGEVLRSQAEKPIKINVSTSTDNNRKVSRIPLVQLQLKKTPHQNMKGESYHLSLCPGRDLNPHTLADT